MKINILQENKKNEDVTDFTNFSRTIDFYGYL